MSEFLERELAVFSAARQLPPGERAACLDKACADDGALRERIQELLRSNEEAGAFLHEPAVGAHRAADALAASGTFPIEAPSGEKVGDRIGRYKLLQSIGEGGCGVVYMAEQMEPVRRRVALKVIKLGMDTKSVIARFEAERQALALMDHPNIAKVLDAGSTEKGRPYFVMELVRGIKITDHCDQNNLSTRERLELFIQVCQAVQHAHQKGVIHRDLKPSNILVTLRDGVPVPKVIDFGIAKATTDQPLTDKTLFTAFEQFMGTPAYMSPEQAEMSELGIDTRSDIYSLGVLLYELLTGRTPFDATELLRSGLDSMRRTIREQEAVRPSTRLSTLIEGELSAVAKLRHTAVPNLIHLLRGDLDWIVMKALEKDRARRYETANGLARDVQRHLADEPVVARPPSAVYQFQKQVRRNKLAFAAATAVVAALVLGICAATWGLVRERAARREAESARNIARVESARNEQVANFLLSTVTPDTWNGQDTKKVRSILLEFFSQRLGTELTNQPGAQGDLWLSVANSSAAIGDYARAINNAQNAANVYRLTFGDGHRKVALAFWRLSNFQRHNKEIAAAKTTAQEAVAIARKSGDVALLATCLLEAAKTFSNSGEPTPEAIPLLREAMRLRRNVVPHLLALLDGTRSLVRALQCLAAQGKLEEARTILNEELKEAPDDRDFLNLLNAFNRMPPGAVNGGRTHEP